MVPISSTIGSSFILAILYVSGHRRNKPTNHYFASKPPGLPTAKLTLALSTCRLEAPSPSLGWNSSAGCSYFVLVPVVIGLQTSGIMNGAQENYMCPTYVGSVGQAVLGNVIG